MRLAYQGFSLESENYILYYIICADSTLSHCAGVHTVCKEGAEGYFIKSVR